MVRPASQQHCSSIQLLSRFQIVELMLFHLDKIESSAQVWNTDGMTLILDQNCEYDSPVFWSTHPVMQ